MCCTQTSTVTVRDPSPLHFAFILFACSKCEFLKDDGPSSLALVTCHWRLCPQQKCEASEVVGRHLLVLTNLREAPDEFPRYFIQSRTCASAHDYSESNGANIHHVAWQLLRRTPRAQTIAGNGMTSTTCWPWLATLTSTLACAFFFFFWISMKRQSKERLYQVTKLY